MPSNKQLKENDPQRIEPLDPVSTILILSLLLSVPPLFTDLNLPESADLDSSRVQYILASILLQLIALIINSRSSSRDAKPIPDSAEGIGDSGNVKELPPLSPEQQLIRKYLESQFNLGKLMALIATDEISFRLTGNRQDIIKIADLGGSVNWDEQQRFHALFSKEVLRLCREACASAPPFIREQIEQRLLPNLAISIGKYIPKTEEVEIRISLDSERLALALYGIKLPPSDNAPNLGSHEDWGLLVSEFAKFSNIEQDYNGAYSDYIISLLKKGQDLISPGLLPMPCPTMELSFKYSTDFRPRDVPEILSQLQTYMPNMTPISAPINFPAHQTQGSNRALEAFRVLEEMLNPLLRTLNDARFQVVWASPNGITRTQEVEMTIIPYYSDHKIFLGFTYKPTESPYQEFGAKSPEAEWFKNFVGQRNENLTWVFVIGANGSERALDAIARLHRYCSYDNRDRQRPFASMYSGPRHEIPGIYNIVLEKLAEQDASSNSSG